MRKKRIHLKLNDLLFFTAYISYLFIALSYDSFLYTCMSGYLYSALWIISAIAIFFGMIYMIKKNRKLYFLLAFFFLSIIVSFFSDDRKVFYAVGVALIAYKIPIRKIVKVAFFEELFLLLLTLALSYTGVIEDKVYPHYSFFSKSVTTVHTYGFMHYSAPQFIIMFLGIMYIYVYGMNIRRLVLFGTISVWSYLTFTTRLPLLCSFIYIFMCVLRMKDYRWKKRKWVTRLLICVPFLLFAISVIINYYFNSSNNLFSILNTLLSTRLSQGKKAFELYSIPLLGQPIQMYGSYYTTVSEGLRYFYIDNDYVLFILKYGVVLTGLVLYTYAYLLKTSYNDNDYVMITWTVTVLLFATINSILIMVEYCPLFIIGVKEIFEEKKKYVNREVIRPMSITSI